MEFGLGTVCWWLCLCPLIWAPLCLSCRGDQSDYFMVRSKGGVEVTLYEQVAGQIEGFISRGIFEPGERLPSIRRLARQMDVSINTVREAYSLLEQRRVAAARSGSGYFVAHLPKRSEADISASLVGISPQPVSVDEISYRVCEIVGRQELLNLSVAAPRASLLPMRRLAALHARVLRRNPESCVAYNTSPGRYGLRQNIAKRLLDVGCTVSVDEITITSGCFDAITVSLLATCRPGDTVAIESPVFYAFLQLLEVLGLQVIEIPSAPRTGMSLDVLDFTLRRYPIAACITVPNFSNPLGSLMPDENKERLVKLAEEHRVPLIEDDVYGELYFGTDRPRVLRSFDTAGNVILCSSFSKTIAPGYRIGWVLGGRFTDRIRQAKMMTSIAPPSVSEVGIEEFLESGGFDRTLRAARLAYRTSTAQVSEAILRHFPQGTRVSQPQGGLVLWVELPGNVDSVQLYHDCLARGISIAPGAIFSSQGKYRNFVRIRSAEYSPAVEEALAVVGGIARGLAEKASPSLAASAV